MLNNERDDQVCDARDDDSSTGDDKIIFITLNIDHGTP